MFQHPALRKNSRSRAFGHFGNGWNVLKLVNPIPLSGTVELGFAQWLRDKGIAVPNDTIPAGSVFVLYNELGAFTDPVVYWMNGKYVRFELDPDAPSMGGVGSREFARRLEAVFNNNPFDKTSFHPDNKTAQAAAEALWGGTSSSASDNYSVSAEEEYETVDAGEPATSDAGKPATATASSGTLKTGYYEGNLKGRAIYYNAERGYIEVVAALPEAGFKTQPKYMRGSEEFKSWETWAKANLSTYKGNSRAARKTVIDIAIKEGGKELPEPGRGGGSSYTPSTASAPTTAPATTPASGTPAPSTGGKKGIPGWVWWTSGTVLVAGLGVWGAIMIKKNKAAVQ